MTIKVLVVDDSNFFQVRLKEIINAHPELTVVGFASNGREAIEKTASLRPDVITMDYEMPMMDGVTAVRQIMHDNPTPILMFSSLTYEGARITLDALEAGAVDFLTKNFSEVSSQSQYLQKKLHNRILAIAKPKKKVAPVVAPTEPDTPTESLKGRFKVLVIGASTGGPLAITEVLKQLPASFPVPILLVLHMPENFTKAFAERLDNQCQISVREAKSGDFLRPGVALLAPGGHQLIVDPANNRTVKVIEGDDRVNYKPCLDVSFASAAKVYGANVLAVVLTGMGSDGREGARLLKRYGAKVWTQDEASCVIYGMPQSIVREGLSDRVVGLSQLATTLTKEL